MKKNIQIAVTLLLAVLAYWGMPADCPEAARRNVLIFVIAALFWALEVIPLYATSLLVVMLEVLLVALPGGLLPSGKGSFQIFFDPLANPVIILFLGGFVLAEAFRKYEMDRTIAGFLLRYFGKKPYAVMSGFMFTTAFLSMWISNTATTALMLVMIAPLTAGLDADDRFKKALVLAVAFAANVGGTMTPVGTPPNALALAELSSRGIGINFIHWMIMTVPLGIILILINSGLLYWIFPPKTKNISFEHGIESGRGFKDVRARMVFTIGVMTALLWLTSAWHKIPESVIALGCVTVLAVTGLFTQDDLKKIQWDILLLMWGGLVLGAGMQVSGLAAWLLAQPFFPEGGMTLIIMFCVVSVVLSTFMSNTATVNLLLPLAVSLPGESPVLLASMIALSSSFDIAIPISTPPMAMAYGTGQIAVKDMLKVGIVFTLIANTLLLIDFKWLMPLLMERFYG